MGFYNDIILPRLCDLAMRASPLPRGFCRGHPARQT